MKKNYLYTFKAYMEDLKIRFGGSSTQIGKVFKLPSWFKLLAVCGIMMLGFGIVNYRLVFLLKIFLGIISTYLMMLGSLALNDICDIECDKISNPTRALPCGKVDKKSLYVVALSLFFMAGLFSLMINVYCFIIVIVELLLCLLHYGYTKRNLSIPGSSELLTPLQAAVMPVYCFFLANNFSFLPILIGALFVYFADVSSDISGAVRDREGDLKNNVKTFAVSFGNKTAAILSTITFFIALFFSILLAKYTLLGPIYLTIVLFAAVYTFYLLTKLIKNPSIENGRNSFVMGSSFFYYTAFGIFVDVFIKIILNSFNITPHFL
jgi:4-hydroxybenzoate polyprenyltransferase